MRRAVFVAISLLTIPASADPALQLEVSPPPSPSVAARDEVGISVSAAPGLTLHPSAPLFVDLDAPGALGLERYRLERAQAIRMDAPSAAFRVGIRPSTAGTHVLGLRVRAWVCRGARCRAVETRRTVRIQVP